MTERQPIRAKRGANLGGANAHNRRVIVDALRINGALSRAELARATCLTAQTVSNIMADLEEAGLVAADGPVRIARGQPATPYRLMPDGAYAIGLQVDRHVARALAVDLLGRDVVRHDRALPQGGPAAGFDVLADLVATTRAALAAARPGVESRLVGLGLAMPGPFGTEPADEDPWMMAAWQRYPLVERLAARTGLQVALQNDASAAAIAERLSGAARGLDDFVLLYVGYGLGAGLVLKGEVLTGAHRNAGEIGLVPTLDDEGRSGRRLEHVASLAALCRDCDLDPGDPDLFDTLAAAVATVPVQRWLDRAAPRLGWAVQILESLFDPQTVVLGGAAPPALMQALIDRMMPLAPTIADRPGRALPRLTLGRADLWMVARGAAAEPIARAFDPRFSAVQKDRGPAPR